MDVLSLIATVVLTVAIYWLQRSHEKEREQMEVEAQKKAVAEAARVFLIDNEDEIEYLPLSTIAKSLNLKRKHHRAITTKFLRCSEEVQKEILKQANSQTIEISKEQVSAALKLLKDDIKTYCFGRDVLYGGAGDRQQGSGTQPDLYHRWDVDLGGRLSDHAGIFSDRKGGALRCGESLWRSRADAVSF